MKSKKSPGADLENKRSLFFLAGLLITLCLVLAAFEWESVPRNDQAFEARDGLNLEQDIYLPPPSDYLKPPPPPMPKLLDVLNVVEEIDPLTDEFPVFDVEPVRGQEIPVVDMPDEEPVPETLPEYAATEKPGFRGGDLNEFRKWIIENLVYPEIAIKNGVSGKVYVQFTVSSKGYVRDVRVIREADPALDEEAVRVISSSPRWTPGKRGIREVNVIFVIPVNFVLR